VGEVFVSLKAEKAQEYIENQKDAMEKEVATLEEEITKALEILTKVRCAAAVDLL
jgi:prefoldin subunit 5